MNFLKNIKLKFIQKCNIIMEIQDETPYLGVTELKDLKLSQLLLVSILSRAFLRWKETV